MPNAQSQHHEAAFGRSFESSFVLALNFVYISLLRSKTYSRKFCVLTAQELRCLDSKDMCLVYSQAKRDSVGTTPNHIGSGTNQVSPVTPRGH